MHLSAAQSCCHTLTSPNFLPSSSHDGSMSAAAGVKRLCVIPVTRVVIDTKSVAATISPIDMA